MPNTPPTLSFQHLGLEEGLSQISVHTILQDRQGFLWVGTSTGLNRYDGHQFTVYRHDKNDPTSIGYNFIYSLALDAQDNLWVGTRGGGLSMLDRRLGTFRNFKWDPADPRSLAGDRVNDMVWRNPNELWVATSGGLCRLDPHRGSISRIESYSKDRGGPLAIQNLALDKMGQLWVTSSRGLSRLNPVTLAVEPIFEGEHRKTLGTSRLSGLGLDEEGRVWIGTRTEGVVRFNPATQEVRYYRAGDSDGLSSNDVWEIYVQNKEIWVGTDHGLNRYEEETDRFVAFRAEPTHSGGLKDELIRGLYIDGSNRLWVGTWAGGLHVTPLDGSLFENLRIKYAADEKPLDDMVLTYHTDRQERLWISTLHGLAVVEKEGARTFRSGTAPENYRADPIWQVVSDPKGRIWVGGSGGVSLLNEDTGHFEHLPIQTVSQKKGLSEAQILAMASDTEGLWIGTRMGGLDRYLFEEDRFENYRPDPTKKNTILSDMVQFLLIDSKDYLWLGTDRGVSRMDRRRGEFKNFVYKGNIEGGLSDGNVYVIHEDEEHPGSVWLGTTTGLNRLNTERGTVDAYYESDGLVNDTIYGIEADRLGRLWLSTGGGISVFDVEKEIFTNFTQYDGLPSNEFNQKTSLRAADGTIYFGSIQGSVVAHPERLTVSQTPVPLVFTRLFLDNQPVQPGTPGSPLAAVIEQTAGLQLQPHHRMISFEFTGLELTRSQRCRYQYQLEGFDSDWLGTDPSNRRATYTNLAPGHYVFRVKNTNADGVWNNIPQTLAIEVLAPWWRRWWAKTGYAAVAMLLVGLYIRGQRRRLAQERAQNERELAHERQINEQQSLMAERLRELDALKDQFLANTSHELKTPLNGIIGLAESLVAGAMGPISAPVVENLNLIASSGRRLASLVGDILDFATMQKGRIELRHRAVDLHRLADEVLAFSSPLAQERGLKLVNSVPPDLPWVWADGDRLTQILLNLVGNAVKFTEAGFVEIQARVEHETVWVTVLDTGIGIPEDRQHVIFEAFQQGDGDVARKYGGTGLGLSITRNLVELHGSTLTLRSKPGEGSSFYFYLPIAEQTKVSQVPTLKQEALAPIPASSPIITRQNPTTARIMVVDDEPINRRVVRANLEMLDYEVVEVADGHRALDAFESEPGSYDLILLDIMMPHLSGFDVCRAMRLIRPLADLPIIFLTARTQVEDLVMAHDAGGSDYLAKPVIREELMARIETHLALGRVHRAMDRQIRERSEALILREKIATLGSLALGVAHEINNPNNLIQGGLTVGAEMLTELKEALGEKEETSLESLRNQINQLDEQLAMALRGAKRIGEVVAQMGQFSTNATQRRRMNLRPCIEAAVLLVQNRDREITIDLDGPKDLYVVGNFAELQMVFLNVLTNSQEAIAARRVREPGAEGRIHLAVIGGKEATIYIRDTGGGIEPGLEDRIFDAFYTTKPPGQATGLGLYHALQIVTLHGGSIRIDSHWGQGLTVHIQLPLFGK